MWTLNLIRKYFIIPVIFVPLLHWWVYFAWPYCRYSNLPHIKLYLFLVFESILITVLKIMCLTWMKTLMAPTWRSTRTSSYYFPCGGLAIVIVFSPLLHPVPSEDTPLRSLPSSYSSLVVFRPHPSTFATSPAESFCSCLTAAHFPDFKLHVSASEVFLDTSFYIFYLWLSPISVISFF